MATKKSTRSPAAKAQPSAAGQRSATAEVDEQLARYRAMRDFSSTAEPSGGTTGLTPPGGLPFVIQKHAATRLHYDFRLGWRGVLKSWACAKGPSYFTGDRRLAVQVEDHPMEYGGFEGTIPKGQYGGGTVLLWDQGTWEPLPGHDVDEGLRKGTLKFTLHGQKLEGRWTLVRMGGRAANESKPNWLLIKEHDGTERPADAPAITDAAPDSVVTGRSLATIAEAEDHVWNSRPAEHGAAAPANHSRLKQKLKDAHLHGTRPASAREQAETSASPAGEVAKKIAGKKRASAKKAKPATSDLADAAPAPQQSTAQSWLEGAPQADMPAFINPQLATAADTIPLGASWLHELKLDGYRVQAHVRAGVKGEPAVTLYTRSGLDWTQRMPAVASAVRKLAAGNAVQQAVLDGEVAVLDDEGRTSFSKLQAAFEKGEEATLSYFAFDLLHLDGHDLRGLPLRIRKALLEPLVASADDPLLIFSQHLEVDANTVYAHACELGAEGILSKDGEARYTSGRSDSWLKLKCTHRQEFVIGGFTLPKDGGSGLGSLLLGYYQKGLLVHCGRCGTGFTQALARTIRKQLEPLRTAKPAFSSTLGRDAKKDAIWVTPDLVCEVQFATWTADGSLRHASFQGMRDDKPADEVGKEETKTLRADNDQQESAVAAEKAQAKPAPAPAKKSATRLTHPDKILDAQSGTTKQHLADYYAAAAPAMLPHLADRPVSIVRCPEGTAKQCFFQKHAAVGLPASLASIAIPDRDNPAHTEAYISVNSAESLLGLAQLGVLELHPWGSQASTLEQPDRLILDLDPDESLAWETVVASAHAIRAFLKELQLESFVKTTGGKGLHIVAAIEPSAEWPDIRLFSRGIAAAIESTDPRLYLIKMTKAARTGRIFLDWMRNERGSTAVAPWSPRARPGMRVAVPLRWDELASGPPTFAISNFNDWRTRLEPKNDPWAAMRPQPLHPDVLQAVLAQGGAAEKAPAKHRGGRWR